MTDRGEAQTRIDYRHSVVWWENTENSKKARDCGHAAPLVSALTCVCFPCSPPLVCVVLAPFSIVVIVIAVTEVVSLVTVATFVLLTLDVMVIVSVNFAVVVPVSSARVMIVLNMVATVVVVAAPLSSATHMPLNTHALSTAASLHIIGTITFADIPDHVKAPLQPPLHLLTMLVVHVGVARG